MEKRKFKTVQMSAIDFVDLYENNKIYLDLSFQRQACWPLSSKVNYIEGLLKGDFPGAILLASIPNHQRDPYDDYFTNLEALKYLYVSIDGNNRTVALYDFIKGKFSVTPLGSTKSVFFSDLSSNDLKMFSDENLTLVTYSGISKTECSEIFINHNESEALRHQELRNARLFAISTYIRDLETNLRKKLPILRKDNKYRKNDEFLLDVLCYQLKPETFINKKRRDEVWYTNRDSLHFDSKYLEDTLRLLPLFLKALNAGSKSSQASSRDFAMIRGIMSEYGKITKNSEEYFIKWISEHRNELVSSHELYTLDDADNTKVSYTTILSNPANPFHFKKRYELLEALVKKAVNNSVVKFVTTRTKLTQDAEIRYELAKLQDFKCPVTNVLLIDPLDGTKWHVDHIIPLSEGGDDDIENMRLVDASFNLRKGARLEVAE